MYRILMINIEVNVNHMTKICIHHDERFLWIIDQILYVQIVVSSPAPLMKIRFNYNIYCN